MKRLIFTILVIAAIFAIGMTVNHLTPSLDVTSEYSNGKITTDVEAKGIENITSTEVQYRIYFLDQYGDVNPRVDTYSFPNYEENHIYKIREELFQGMKDHIEVKVVISYDDGTQETMGNAVIEDIKQKVYNDFVIEPEIVDNRVYYRANGLTAIISKDSYDEEIIFYSDPNSEEPNIAVGFHKDYSIYPLDCFSVISKTVASEIDFEGMALVDSIKDPGVDESYIVVKHAMIELIWDGRYPYDLDGNEVVYEGKTGDTGINLVRDNHITEISKASYEKYSQMRNKVPNITFKISR